MRKRPQKPPTPPEERPPRAEVPAGVRVFLDKVGDGEKAVGWAKNLSKGGMYIECKDGMTLDAEVSIQALARVGNTLHKIKLNGWVVHAQGDGLGIQFDDMDRDALLTIKHLVDAYLEQPA